ncbi:hypothetical protein B7463_g9287, partial [Scytalidium lignicola]
MDSSKSKVGVTVHEQRVRENSNSSNSSNDSIDDHDNDSQSSEESPLLGHDDSLSDGARKGTDEWNGHEDFEGLPWWKTPSVYWLLPPFFLFALSFGGIIVPKLNLILSLVCRRYLADRAVVDPSFTFSPVLLGTDNPQCRIPEVQSLVSKFMLWMTVSTGTLSAVVAPKFGAFSDRYGRLRLLTLTSFGMLLSELFTIFAATFPDTIHHKWLLAGALVEGLCGSFTTGMSMAHAYAADVTHPTKRNVAFGYFSACLFSGIAIGPLIAGYVVKWSGSLITIFYIALGVHIFFILFILICVPESLSRKKQLLARQKYAALIHGTEHEGITWLWALKHGNLFEPLRILWPTGPGTSGYLRANLVLLAGVDTTIFGVAMGSATVVVYYIGFFFGWETADTNFFISLVNSSRVAALIILLPILNYIFRIRPRNRQRRESGIVLPEKTSGSDVFELSIVRVAILFEILGYGGYAVARNGHLFRLAGVFTAFGGLGSPMLSAGLTKHVPHEKVGQLLGATGLLHALARIVCPTVFNLIYAGTVGTYPQAVFVVLASCFFVAFLASWFIRPHVYLDAHAAETGGHASEDDAAAEDAFLDEEIGAY